jgi:hypothetical protein
MHSNKYNTRNKQQATKALTIVSLCTMTSHQEEGAPAAKRLKLDDDTTSNVSVRLNPVVTVEYPHVCHGVRAIVAVSEDEILTCARRDIKVWKKDTGDSWSCSKTLGTNLWAMG